MTLVRVGTRGSALALAQTRQVTAALAARHPQHRFEAVPMETSGDRTSAASWQQGGQKGLYVKELEEALLAGELQMAVHSAKDLPSQLPQGLGVGAWFRRADPRDVLLLRTRPQETGDGLKTDADDLLTRAAGRIFSLATSSVRRRALVRHHHPEINIKPMRGNVDTRLKKLAGGAADGLILAAAGLERLGCAQRIDAAFAPQRHVPAPGQGALAIEIRQDDKTTQALLAPVADEATAAAVTAERAVARILQGDCRLPLAAFAWHEGGLLQLVAAIGEPDGRRLLRAQARGAAAAARELGERVAGRLMAQGGDKILAAVREGDGPP